GCLSKVIGEPQLSVKRKEPGAEALRRSLRIIRARGSAECIPEAKTRTEANLLEEETIVGEEDASARNREAALHRVRVGAGPGLAEELLVIVGLRVEADVIVVRVRARADVVGAADVHEVRPTDERDDVLLSLLRLVVLVAAALVFALFARAVQADEARFALFA